MQTYFSNFPIVQYGNNVIRDLTRAVKIDNSLRDKTLAFYPYDIGSGIRSDIISHTYYNDADLDWLIYLTNGIVDPYYGWFLNESQFQEYIKDKYSTIDYSQQKIVYWETNWLEDMDLNISVATYESFPIEIKKYWTPVTGVNNQIISYKRKQTDITVATNKIIKLTVGDTSEFNDGDLVQCVSLGSVIGTAEITSIIDSENVLIQHTLDDWIVNKKLVLRSDASIETTISVIETVQETITDDERAYWKPVYAYDDEFAENETKQIILLMDSSYIYDATRSISNILKE